MKADVITRDTAQTGLPWRPIEEYPWQPCQVHGPDGPRAFFCWMKNNHWSYGHGYGSQFGDEEGLYRTFVDGEWEIYPTHFILCAPPASTEESEQ